MNAAGEVAQVARVAASLVVVVLLVVLGARLARRAGLRGTGTALRVRERVPLSREAFVAVVEVADRGLVLGVGPQGVRLLSELDAETLARSYPEPDDAPRPRPPRRPGLGRPGLARPGLARPGSGELGRPGSGGPGGRRRPAPADEVTSVEVGPDGVRVTRVPDGAPTRPRGTGSVLDPRTWRQAVEALRDLTARHR